MKPVFKPALQATPVAIKAAIEGKALYVVAHGRFNNDSISAYGNGITLRPRQDQYRTKKAAERNLAEHLEPLTARHYNRTPKLYEYSAEEVRRAMHDHLPE